MISGGLVGDFLSRRAPAGHLITIAAGLPPPPPACIVLIFAPGPAGFSAALLFAGAFPAVFTRAAYAGRHVVVVEPPVPMPDGSNDLEAAVVELTARCTAVIERVVRQTPEQWLWAHDRWRTRPPTGGP